MSDNTTRRTQGRILDSTRFTMSFSHVQRVFLLGFAFCFPSAQPFSSSQSKVMDYSYQANDWVEGALSYSAEVSRIRQNTSESLLRPLDSDILAAIARRASLEYPNWLARRGMFGMLQWRQFDHQNMKQGTVMSGGALTMGGIPLLVFGPAATSIVSTKDSRECKQQWAHREESDRNKRETRAIVPIVGGLLAESLAAPRRYCPVIYYDSLNNEIDICNGVLEFSCREVLNQCLDFSFRDRHPPNSDSLPEDSAVETMPDRHEKNFTDHRMLEFSTKLHSFQPLLLGRKNGNWLRRLLYRLTQARLHEWVMRRFHKYFWNTIASSVLQNRTVN